MNNNGSLKQKTFYNTTRKKLKRIIEDTLEENEKPFVYRTDSRGEAEISKAFIKETRLREMRLMFMEIWSERPRRSEVSGKSLGKEALSTYFHHILAKSKHPELALIPENIILLTPDEHANVESDMYKYEEVNRRRKALEEKYL